MSILSFTDIYAATLSGGMTVTAPSGGTTSFDVPANLFEPVLGRVATLTWDGLPSVSGRYGPARITVSAIQYKWPAYPTVGFLNTDLPGGSRVEFEMINSGFASAGPYLVGQNFAPARPGVLRHVVFTTSIALGAASSTVTLQADLYLPTPSGSLTVGRLWVGDSSDVTYALMGQILDDGADQAVVGESISGLRSGRSRGVLRVLSLQLIQTGGTPTPIQLLDAIGTASHCVLVPGAGIPGVAGPPVDPRIVYGTLMPPLRTVLVAGNELQTDCILKESR